MNGEAEASVPASSFCRSVALMPPTPDSPTYEVANDDLREVVG